MPSSYTLAGGRDCTGRSVTAGFNALRYSAPRSFTEQFLTALHCRTIRPIMRGDPRRITIVACTLGRFIGGVVPWMEEENEELRQANTPGEEITGSTEAATAAEYLVWRRAQACRAEGAGLSRSCTRTCAVRDRSAGSGIAWIIAERANWRTRAPSGLNRLPAATMRQRGLRHDSAGAWPSRLLLSKNRNPWVAPCVRLPFPYKVMHDSRSRFRSPAG